MSLAPHLLAATGMEEATDGDVLPLPDATRHHLRRVLRLTDGAPLSVTDGHGRLAAAVLDGDGARVVGAVQTSTSPTPRIVLAQALSKGRRAEEGVRVACELGVDRLVPIVAARTQGRPDARAAAGLVARWDAVAVAALEQSRGVRRAAVVEPVEVAVLAAEAPDPLRLVAVPGAPPLPEVVAGTADGAVEVVIAVGPEGGWTPEEVSTFVAAGWHAVGLGPSVLRTEHAGPVAVAVLAALLGRWGHRASAPAEESSGATLPRLSVEESWPPVSGPL